MREPLDISFPSNSFLICPSEELKKRGEELLSLTELRQRLEYYNKHICSLCYTYPQEGLFNYGMYEHGHSYGERFFWKERRGGNVDFDILLQERQKEIDRLKELVSRQETYFEKLKCFIEDKAGQLRFDELVLNSNEYYTFIADGAGVVPQHLLNYQAEIDLQPSTPEEIQSYNKYVREYVEQLVYGTQKRHWLAEEKYHGFLALPAMNAILEQFKRAFDKRATIRAELDRIESHFKYYSFQNYSDFLYPYSIDNLAIWQAALFNAFARGRQFDYSKRALKVHEMKALIHVEQVFFYYKYVQLFRDNTVYGSFKELFEDAVENGILNELKTQKMLPVKVALYSYLFIGWLQKQRLWEYGDVCGYQMHLTKQEFEEFIKYYKAEEQARVLLIGSTREEANQIYHKNFQTIQEWFWITRKASKEDCKLIPRLKEGDIIKEGPSYSSTEEAFALLSGCYSPQFMELEKMSFVEKYKTWNATTIHAEILEIESFITKANSLKLSDACNAFNKWGEDTNEFIFLRFKSGFYENLEIQKYVDVGGWGSKEAQVYGRYFLFYNFLKMQYDVLCQTPIDSVIDGRIKAEKDKSKSDKSGSRNIIIDFINNFDKSDINEIYHHFKEGLVDKKYLTETELLLYLKAAFEDKKAPVTRFKFIGAPKKEKIMQVFYRYYAEIASKPYGKQQQYAALLGDYFMNYNTSTVRTNFSKTI